MSDVEEREQPTLQEQPRVHPRPSPLHSAVSSAIGDEDSRTREDTEIIKAGLAAVKEWEAEHGPIAPEALAWAKSAFDEALRSSRELQGK